MRSARPFLFDEFGAKDEIAPASPDALSVEALEQARADGVIEGRRLALESIAADEAGQLARIAVAIEKEWASASAADERVRSEVMALARIFIEEFCAGVLARREIETAENLLQRLVENSEDRRSVRLLVSAKSISRLETRLQAAINRCSVGDFVSVEGDVNLSPGEARLEWRGGEISRGREEISLAIAAIFNSIDDQHAEAGDDRT